MLANPAVHLRAGWVKVPAVSVHHLVQERFARLFRTPNGHTVARVAVRRSCIDLVRVLNGWVWLAV